MFYDYLLINSCISIKFSLCFLCMFYFLFYNLCISVICFFILSFLYDTYIEKAEYCISASFCFSFSFLFSGNVSGFKTALSQESAEFYSNIFPVLRLHMQRDLLQETYNILSDTLPHHKGADTSPD